MLAAAAAPAFVRSDSLMKLWVPQQEIITFPPPGGPWGKILIRDLHVVAGDFIRISVDSEGWKTFTVTKTAQIGAGITFADALTQAGAL